MSHVHCGGIPFRGLGRSTRRNLDLTPTMPGLHLKSLVSCDLAAESAKWVAFLRPPAAAAWWEGGRPSTPGKGRARRVPPCGPCPGSRCFVSAPCLPSGSVALPAIRAVSESASLRFVSAVVRRSACSPAPLPRTFKRSASLCANYSVLLIVWRHNWRPRRPRPSGRSGANSTSPRPRRAALKLQGQYMGYMRALKPMQKGQGEGDSRSEGHSRGDRRRQTTSALIPSRRHVSFRDLTRSITSTSLMERDQAARYRFPVTHDQGTRHEPAFTPSGPGGACGDGDFAVGVGPDLLHFESPPKAGPWEQ